MELNIYEIIQGPLISDKAYKLNQKLNQLVLRVHPKANKPLIKDAIEKLFNVKVKEVRTMIRKKSTAKAMQRKYNSSQKIVKKKIAYVTLAEGYSLNLFNQANASSEETVSDS